MATSSIDSIFTVSRGHLEEDRNALKKKVSKLKAFFKKAACKIQMDRRLESLHFKGRS